MKVSLENLSEFLDVAPNQLGALIFRTDLFYQEITIAKRRGGIRRINIPNNILRTIQKNIYRDVLGKFQAHEAAQAYVKKRSIVTNAANHLDSRYMLKLDIENFFGNLSTNLVADKFIQISEVFDRQRVADVNVKFPRFTDAECRLLAKICTLDGGLPQGAITSPHLSNLIFYKTDEAINNHCNKLGIKYTRYSDDMIFTSLTDQVFEVEDFVKHEIQKLGLRLNYGKSIRLNDRQSKYVTGLSIHDKKIRLSKSRRREIRQEFYNFNSRKIINDSIYDNNPSKASLLGKLEFWKFIEPECDFPRKAIALIVGTQ